MKITHGNFGRCSARVTAGIFGNNPSVRVDGCAYNLTAGEITVRLLTHNKTKSKVHVFISLCALLFACVLFGPFGLLALVLFWGGNRESATVQLKTNTDRTLYGVANAEEWKILRQYLTL